MLKKCKYLLWLFVWLIWFTCFSNATVLTWFSQSWADWAWATIDWQNWYCYIFLSNRPNVYIYDENNSLIQQGVSTYNPQICFFNWTWKIVNNWDNSMSYIYYKNLSLCSECQSCPSTSITLFHWDSFNVPISWVNNNLFIPIEDDYTVSENQFGWLNFSITHNSFLSSWYSELVINNIVHEWRPLININIPDYIQWDYAVDENQYDIYVWSWYDQDYIDSVLKINSYRPDNKDFTQIFVSWLTLIFPYIFVALLIVFIWKLLKRIFK